MVIVVRLGALPLQRRRPARIAELERIFGIGVQLIEVVTVAELAAALRTPNVVAVVLDAPPPGQLTDAIAAAGSLPVLGPLWRRRPNTRGETDEVFDGYGLLTASATVRLADGGLATL